MRGVVVTAAPMQASGRYDDDLWQTLLAGRSLLAPLPDEFLTRTGLDRRPGPWVAPPSGQPTGVQAAQVMQRLGKQTRLSASPQRQRLGLVWGSSKGSLGEPPESWERTTSFPGRLAPSHPLDVLTTRLRPDRATCPTAACATGLVSLIQAARWIRWGECDAVVAGSADSSINVAVLASYRRLGVLTAGKPSPFGTGRDGFAVGSGAAALMLDEFGHASKCGRQPLARWLGDDLRSDPSGLVQADPSGEAVAVCVGNALAMAGLAPDAIDAISLHGTGTRQNDLAEGRGLRRVFGSRLDAIPAFSVKGAIGHTLGAAGAIETAVCVRMLAEQIVPPHVMSGPIDLECEVTSLAPTPREMPLRHVLKLSLGFGGHVAAAVLGRA